VPVDSHQTDFAIPRHLRGAAAGGVGGHVEREVTSGGTAG
jgi:hypothetical protein